MDILYYVLVLSVESPTDTDNWKSAKSNHTRFTNWRKFPKEVSGTLLVARTTSSSEINYIPVISVKCYHGGQDIHLLPSISKILT